MYDVFLGYRSTDRDEALRVHSALKALGLKVFFDKDSIPAGANFDLEISRAINGSKCVFILWSKEAAQSREVVNEGRRGIELEKFVSAKIKDVLNTDLPPYAGGSEIIDLRKFVELKDDDAFGDSEFQRILRSIGSYTNKSDLPELARATAARDPERLIEWAQKNETEPKAAEIVRDYKTQRRKQFADDSQNRLLKIRKLQRDNDSSLDSLKGDYAKELEKWDAEVSQEFDRWLDQIHQKNAKPSPVFPPPPISSLNQVAAKHEAQIWALREEKAELQSDLKAAQSALADEKLQREKIEANLRPEMERLRESSGRAEALQIRVSELTTALEQKSQDAAQLTAEVKDLKERETLRGGDSAKKDLEAAIEDLATQKSRVSSLEAELKGEREKTASVEQALKKAQSDAGAIPALTAQVTMLQDAESKARSELSSAKRSLDAAQNEIAPLRAANVNTEARIADLQRRLSESETRLSATLATVEKLKTGGGARSAWFGVLLAVISLGGAGAYFGQRIINPPPTEAEIAGLPTPSAKPAEEPTPPAEPAAADPLAGDPAAPAASPTFTNPLPPSDPPPPPEADNSAAAATPAEPATPPANADAPRLLPKDCETCPQLVRIPAGALPSGAQVDAFAIGETEVTRAQFRLFVTETRHKFDTACMLREGDDQPGRIDYALDDRSSGGWIETDVTFDEQPDDLKYVRNPVVCVSHRDAEAYANWLSAKTGKRVFKLPSPEQWELAARAGSNAERPWDSNCADGQIDCPICKHANFLDQAANKQSLKLPENTTKNRVACDDGAIRLRYADLYAPNAYLVKNMFGNAAEWTSRCFDPAESYAGWMNTQRTRVCMTRGGSWVAPFEEAQFAWANRYAAERTGTETVGIRLAATLVAGE